VSTAPFAAAGRVSSSVVLSGVVVLAAVLRFSTLGLQSYWIDEGYTVGLVRLDFVSMLRTIPKTESTPPLYYIVAWVWARLFGTSEAGLRSLSALVGTATVLVAYLLGKEFVSRRAGLVAAALAAVNPLLVWYSQEARAYPLLILFGGLSLLFFGRTLRRPSRGVATAWAVCSVLALATHYFAFFLVTPEAVWLLQAQRRRLIAVRVALVELFVLALAPLAWYQHRGKAYGFGHESLVTRVIKVPKEFAVGYGAPFHNILAVLASLLIAAALGLLVRRSTPPERAGSAILATIALAAVVVPLALAVVGVDYFSEKNLVAALLPALVVIASGFAASRIGLVATAALTVVFLGVVLSVATDRNLQRTDWRGAVRALGAPAGNRAIVVIGSGGRFSPVLLYAHDSHAMNPAGATVSQVALIGVAKEIGAGDLRLPHGFTRSMRERVQQLTVELFRSSRPVPLSPTLLQQSFTGNYPTRHVRVLLQQAQGGT
jgi:mannosyltransferase